MPNTTTPIDSGGELLRLDPATGALRRRRYRLTVLTGADSGRAVTFDERLLIGTRPDAGLPLTDSTVSRSHLELEPGATGLRVRDRESTNGTHLSGVRIRDVVLTDEAVLVVGKTR